MNYTGDTDYRLEAYIEEVRFYQNALQRSFDELGNEMLRADSEQALLSAYKARQEVVKIAERCGHTLAGVQ